jgi:hypothetical protein
MNTKNILTSLAVSVVVVILGFSFWGGRTNTVVEKVVVGGAGQGQSARVFFYGGATFSGAVATTSTATSYTTNARDFFNQPTVISWLPNINTTVSLSSTSTLGYVPNVGDVATVYFRNASSTDAATITFAAVDAGLDVQINEGTGGDLILNGEDWAKLTIIHTSQHLVTVIMDEFIEGD